MHGAECIQHCRSRSARVAGGTDRQAHMPRAHATWKSNYCTALCTVQNLDAGMMRNMLQDVRVDGSQHGSIRPGRALAGTGRVRQGWWVQTKYAAQLVRGKPHAQKKKNNAPSLKGDILEQASDVVGPLDRHGGWEVQIQRSCSRRGGCAIGRTSSGQPLDGRRNQRQLRRRHQSIHLFAALGPEKGRSVCWRHGQAIRSIQTAVLSCVWTNNEHDGAYMGGDKPNVLEHTSRPAASGGHGTMPQTGQGGILSATYSTVIYCK